MIVVVVCCLVLCWWYLLLRVVRWLSLLADVCCLLVVSVSFGVLFVW